MAVRKLTHQEIAERQVIRSRYERISLVVILDNIRSLNNVGAIFRTADGIGIEKIYLCGITGYPPQAEIQKTALGAEESVPWEYQKDIVLLAKRLKDKGFELVALEQSEGALPYDEYYSKNSVALILGNEVEGVSEDVLALCDHALEIPMYGIKNSLNVSSAFSAIGFHLRRVLTGKATSL